MVLMVDDELEYAAITEPASSLRWEDTVKVQMISLLCGGKMGHSETPINVRVSEVYQDDPLRSHNEREDFSPPNRLSLSLYRQFL